VWCCSDTTSHRQTSAANECFFPFSLLFYFRMGILPETTVASSWPGPPINIFLPCDAAQAHNFLPYRWPVPFPPEKRDVQDLFVLEEELICLWVLSAPASCGTRWGRASFPFPPDFRSAQFGEHPSYKRETPLSPSSLFFVLPRAATESSHFMFSRFPSVSFQLSGGNSYPVPVLSQYHAVLHWRPLGSFF